MVLSKVDLTATAFVFHKNRVLLIHHRKLDRWLPPGGHIDINETPDEAAVREVFEETGVSAKLIPNHDFAADHVRPLPIEANVHSVGDHDHYVQAFVGVADSDDVSASKRELKNVKWVSRDEIDGFELTDYLKSVTRRAFDVYEEFSKERVREDVVR